VVGHGDGPLVLGAARQEHRLDAEGDELLEEPLRLRQHRRAPLQHVLVEARRVVRLSTVIKKRNMLISKAAGC